jgi:hypothetical protein
MFVDGEPVMASEKGTLLEIPLQRRAVGQEITVKFDFDLTIPIRFIAKQPIMTYTSPFQKRINLPAQVSTSASASQLAKRSSRWPST